MGGERARGGPGFTLIELIVTLSVLVIVLGMAYKILENCLRTEHWVEREALPEKIGTGIISLVRRDLEGAVYRMLGTDRVFEVIDGGSGEAARDEIRLYTTREPTPLEETGAGPEGLLTPRTITAVTYYLKDNRQGLYTLYRRENTVSDQDPFESAGGVSYEIYDKVKSFSIACFDAAGREAGLDPWVESWDSRQRLLEEAEAEAALAPDAGIPETGVARVSETQTESEIDEAIVPPAAIPTAVRVEILIFAGDETGLYKEKDGSLKPQVFSAIVPILASQRIPLSEEEGLMGGEAAGAEGGQLTQVTGGGGGSSTREKPKKTPRPERK